MTTYTEPYKSMWYLDWHIIYSNRCNYSFEQWVPTRVKQKSVCHGLCIMSLLCSLRLTLIFKYSCTCRFLYSYTILYWLQVYYLFLNKLHWNESHHQIRAHRRLYIIPTQKFKYDLVISAFISEQIILYVRCIHSKDFLRFHMYVCRFKCFNRKIKTKCTRQKNTTIN